MIPIDPLLGRRRLAAIITRAEAHRWVKLLDRSNEAEKRPCRSSKICHPKELGQAHSELTGIVLRTNLFAN